MATESRDDLMGRDEVDSYSEASMVVNHIAAMTKWSIAEKKNHRARKWALWLSFGYLRYSLRASVTTSPSVHPWDKAFCLALRARSVGIET